VVIIVVVLGVIQLRVGPHCPCGHADVEEIQGTSCRVSDYRREICSEGTYTMMMVTANVPFAMAQCLLTPNLSATLQLSRIYQAMELGCSGSR
jgi:hypothetical protein